MHGIIRKMILLIVVTLGVAAVFSETTGVRRKRVWPYDYGNLVISNFSQKNDIAPLMFNHWLHRAKYTCRLCHVDLGFAMVALLTCRYPDNLRELQNIVERFVTLSASDLRI